jgi:hypothetical protein
MIKIDNYFKIIASTFGLAYFVGLVIAFFYIISGKPPIVQTHFISQLFLTSPHYFKEIFVSSLNTSIQVALIPLSYLIIAVQYGYTHAALLTSPFLGQIKLLVQLIPQFFFFISFIIFSTLGIKLYMFIIKEIVNRVFLEKNKYRKIRVRFLFKKDINFLFIGLLSLFIGSIIQIHLIRILFVFFINLKSITYIMIIILYLVLIFLSGYVTYKAIKDILYIFNKNKNE